MAYTVVRSMEPSVRMQPTADQTVFHFRVDCGQCFGWKKQINRARTAAKKAGRK